MPRTLLLACIFLLLMLARSGPRVPRPPVRRLRRVASGTPPRTPCPRSSARNPAPERRDRPEGVRERVFRAAAQDAVGLQGPETQLFLADGRYFYFLPAGSSQVIRRVVDERARRKDPLLLLFGKGEITTLFRVDAGRPRKGGEETVLRLSPRGTGRRGPADRSRSSARGMRSSAKFTSSTGWAGRTTFTLPRDGKPFPARRLFPFRKPAGVSVWTVDAGTPKAPTVRIHTLGCGKNAVDAEVMRASCRKVDSSSCPAAGPTRRS